MSNEDNKELQIIIWDVQHGSSAYVKTPNGKNIVIDLGTGKYSNNEEFSPLMHLKENYDVEQLDEVIITHPHTDHIDDIMNFDELSPKVLARPHELTEEDIRNANKDSDSDKIDKYIEICNKYTGTISQDENPNLSDNNGGVSIQKFKSVSCGHSNINNFSIVTVINYLGVKVIIPGDNQSASWKELLDNSSFTDAIKDADIFVASHHGRDSGYYSDLFTYFTPRLVIISDGPEGDTSVTEKYDNITKGWTVYKRSDNSSEERKCLTTRNDGVIVIKIGPNDNNRKYINVTIE